MDALDPLALLVAPLSRANVPYLITGSVATIHYGEPRYTNDVDLVIALPAERSGEIPSLYPPPEFYCPDADFIAAEITREEGAHFNVLHVDSGIKADFYPSRRHPYYEWAFAHRRGLEIDGITWWFAPPEYVAMWKLAFHREGGSDKHIRDVRSMIRVQGAQMDLELLERAVSELRLQREWLKVNTPPIPQ
ncbi:MAG: hypothetical protein C0518_14275 [Opitutus sp.]|nr:hypothetical protein [Opitutus sp.]